MPAVRRCGRAAIREVAPRMVAVAERAERHPVLAPLFDAGRCPYPGVLTLASKRGRSRREV